MNQVAPLHWQHKALLNVYSLCYEKCGCSYGWAWTLAASAAFAWLCVWVCVCAHPVVQLWGELGQEAADCSFAVVSLYEHLCHQWCAVPQLLKVVELNAGHGTSPVLKWVSGAIHINSCAGVVIPLSPHFSKRPLVVTIKYITRPPFTALWCWAMCFIPKLSFL